MNRLGSSLLFFFPFFSLLPKCWIRLVPSYDWRAATRNERATRKDRRTINCASAWIGRDSEYLRVPCLLRSETWVVSLQWRKHYIPESRSSCNLQREVILPILSLTQLVGTTVLVDRRAVMLFFFLPIEFGSTLYLGVSSFFFVSPSRSLVSRVFFLLFSFSISIPL